MTYIYPQLKHTKTAESYSKVFSRILDKQNFNLSQYHLSSKFCQLRVLWLYTILKTLAPYLKNSLYRFYWQRLGVKPVEYPHNELSYGHYFHFASNLKKLALYTSYCTSVVPYIPQDKCCFQLFFELGCCDLFHLP